MKTRMLRIVGAAVLLLLAGGSLRPAFALFDTPTSFETSSTVSVSTSMQTGASTLIGATNSSAQVYLYAPATGGITGETVAIGSVVSVSTNASTGNFRFPVNTLFLLGDYKGPLYAISVSTTPLKVSVLRKH